jgi:hypothetical protein
VGQETHLEMVSCYRKGNASVDHRRDDDDRSEDHDVGRHAMGTAGKSKG